MGRWVGWLAYACGTYRLLAPHEKTNHLVLPLAGHDLAVDAGDGDLRVHASAVVCLGDAATVGVLEPDRAVVRALRPGLTLLRPAERGHLKGGLF